MASPNLFFCTVLNFSSQLDLLIGYTGLPTLCSSNYLHPVYTDLYTPLTSFTLIGQPAEGLLMGGAMARPWCLGSLCDDIISHKDLVLFLRMEC